MSRLYQQYEELLIQEYLQCTDVIQRLFHLFFYLNSIEPLEGKVLKLLRKFLLQYQNILCTLFFIKFSYGRWTQQANLKIKPCAYDQLSRSS